MNNESGHCLIMAITSLLLTSLLLVGLNKSLISALTHTKLLKQSQGDKDFPDCGTISKETITAKCQNINGKKRLVIYEN